MVIDIKQSRRVFLGLLKVHTSAPSFQVFATQLSSQVSTSCDFNREFANVPIHFPSHLYHQLKILFRTNHGHGIDRHIPKDAERLHCGTASDIWQTMSS